MSAFQVHARSTNTCCLMRVAGGCGHTVAEDNPQQIKQRHLGRDLSGSPTLQASACKMRSCLSPPLEHHSCGGSRNTKPGGNCVTSRVGLHYIHCCPCLGCCGRSLLPNRIVNYLYLSEMSFTVRQIQAQTICKTHGFI
eukprot:3504518-Amphidinium_carterae.1